MQRGLGGVAQVIEPLSFKHKVLSSNTSTTKKQQQQQTKPAKCFQALGSESRPQKHWPLRQSLALTDFCTLYKCPLSYILTIYFSDLCHKMH
jgi:hypothetical protein